jgi:hypothetical protein
MELYDGWRSLLAWRRRSAEAPEVMASDVEALLDQARAFVAAAFDLCGESLPPHTPAR